MKDIIAKVQEREIFGRVKQVSPLPGGLVNSSYSIESKAGRFILQKEATDIGGISIKDYLLLEDHLRRDGLRIPRIFDHWQDTEGAWKVMEYIEHTPITIPRTEFAVSAARLLGSVHASLKKSGWRPSRTIPGFHDSKAIFRRLGEIYSTSYSSEVNKLAKSILAEEDRFAIPVEGNQLIHGDPKWKNFLFGPATGDIPKSWLIDWETLMVGHPLLDLGDMIRSFCNESNRFDTWRFKMVCVNYRLDSTFGPKSILDATKLITLELAARYLIDCFEDRYFRWDMSRHRTRFAANLAAAEKYVSYYGSMPEMP